MFVCTYVCAGVFFRGMWSGQDCASVGVAGGGIWCGQGQGVRIHLGEWGLVSFARE